MVLLLLVFVFGVRCPPSCSMGRTMGVSSENRVWVRRLERMQSWSLEVVVVAAAAAAAAAAAVVVVVVLLVVVVVVVVVVVR